MTLLSPLSMNEIPQELSGIIFCYELLKLIDVSQNYFCIAKNELFIKGPVFAWVEYSTRNC